MNPLRPAVLSAVLPGLLAVACLAGPNVEAPSGGGAASQVGASPQAIGSMASLVQEQFRPSNPDFQPARLAGVLAALQRVGTAGGPTREQMAPVIAQIQGYANYFDPRYSENLKPGKGLQASLRLELLNGPLKAWLTDGQRDFIGQAHEAYAARLTSQDRQRLREKMKAMALALGEGRLPARAVSAPIVDARDLPEAGSQKETLWREHSRLTLAAGRELDPHDLFGDAADIFARPGRFVGPAAAPVNSGGLGARLRRFFEKAGAAAYLSGTLTREGIDAAHSVLQSETPATTEIGRFAEQLDNDYYNAHGFYPPAAPQGTAQTAPQAPAAKVEVPTVMRQASALAGPSARRPEEDPISEFARRLDQEYFDEHGYYPGQAFARKAPGPVRDFLVKISPLVAIALFAGLLAAPHGVVILVLAARLGAGAAIVYLARRLRRKAFFDEDFKRPWLAMVVGILLELSLGWASILSTLAVIAGLLPR